MEIRLAGGDHDALGFCAEVVDGGFLIQSGLDAGDGIIVMGACALDSVQTIVEVDELTVHLPEVLAKIGGEVLDQLLHGGSVGVHGLSGLWIPV